MAQTKSNAAAEAQRVLSRHWGGEVPVDIYTLARGLGLRLFESKSATAPLARYAVTGSGPEITLAPNLVLMRKRFAVAHALGHHLLAGTDAQFKLIDFSLDVPADASRQANEFALHIMIPAEALDVAVRAARGVDALADLFVVSPVAMKARLTELGVLSGA